MLNRPDTDYYPLVKGLIREYRREVLDDNANVIFEVLAVEQKGESTEARCRTIWLWENRKPRMEIVEYPVFIHPDGVYTDKTLEFPLPLRIGKKWVVSPDSLEITSLLAVIECKAGKFEDCLRVSYQIAKGDLGNGEIFYAPGVGLLREDRNDAAEPYKLELISYHVPK